MAYAISGTCMITLIHRIYASSIISLMLLILWSFMVLFNLDGL